ncbi:MAG TPA: nitroreductase family deazaflavin-dependent oxidoreductase [Candidatus Limnocylindrales bacterium]|nr:nitroreductase family deazaflavin-dependent oxidoreductase [Candidatus Limnocylindrales bacterium]
MRSNTTGQARVYRRSRADRYGDAVFMFLARIGIGPCHLLTTRGRKTGQPHTNPVVLVKRNGQRWLVAPYGAVAWVHNARAAGTVTLRRGREVADYAIREVLPVEAGPVLKRYLAVAAAARPYFKADKDSPVEEFVAEARRHPVFALTPRA